jgi:PEP-CTERM motif
MNLRLMSTIAAFVATLSILATPARSSVVFGIQPGLSAVPGSTGNTFDVVLQNSGPADVSIDTFNFEVDTTDTDITFSQSSVNTTTVPYIFSGNSFDVAFGLTLNTMSPGQSMDGIDNTNTPNTFTVLGAGETLGLGSVSYDVLAIAPIGSTATITFNLSNSSVSFQGDALDSTAQQGSLDIVPEPGTLAIVALGISFSVWRFRRLLRCPDPSCRSILRLLWNDRRRLASRA